VLATAVKYGQLDDDLLVCQSLEGDEKAKSELVGRFLPRVWRIVYLNAGAHSDVEDLVQTAMMTALENLSSYRGPDKFKFWLDRLTINVVRSHFRKSKLRKIFFSEIDPEQAISPNHHGDARRLETQQLFRKLTVHLSRIGAKNRMALVLSMVHGYQAKEIAEIVNCSTEAAWKRTKRGYDELMTRIARDTELDRNLKELFHA
jgi:RNA polymerase sigma factor (sigma-70 family)